MAEIESRAEIVCDAGPLIHLDELGCLDLLSDFKTILVPVQVWDEVLHHRPTLSAAPHPLFQQVSIEISVDADFQAMARAFVLDHGEQAALSLMRLRSEAIFLTDDAAARLAARALGDRTHGSIGILLRSIRRGQRTSEQVLYLLRALPTISTLHIRSSLLQQIIGEVETEGT
ncbi:MAG TPA: DNA-binding protein [Thermoanaerobaculia bacterium]|nr:DNA-binding protein [Thermoanaerobaculia bacterium]